MIFALSADFGAEAVDIQLNNTTVGLDAVDNTTNTYWIKTKKQLQALGNASATETSDKTFYLLWEQKKTDKLFLGKVQIRLNNGYSLLCLSVSYYSSRS